MDTQITLYMPDPASLRVIECSPPSWMIQLALEEKELPYETRLLSFSAGEHRSPEMLARNPRGTVPVLTDGPIALYESFAILEYLEFAYPDPPLLPGTTALRALALTRLHESSHLKSAGMDLFAYLMKTRGLDLDPEAVNRLAVAFHDELFYWEYYYGVGNFAAGSQASLADFSVFTYLATAVHLGLPLDERYPNLGRFYERMKARISVVTSWPPWKTAPYRYLAETV